MMTKIGCVVLTTSAVIVGVGIGFMAGFIIPILAEEAEKAGAIDDSHEGTHLRTHVEGTPWWRQ